MSEFVHPLDDLTIRDPRYKRDAYQFIRDALAYAQDELQLGDESGEQEERHLSGQQLCEAIRQLALEQFGLMAKTVLNSWGVTRTADFGEIVYNLIDVGMMKKSPNDRREHFDDVYDFDTAFRVEFEFTMPGGE